MSSIQVHSEDSGEINSIGLKIENFCLLTKQQRFVHPGSKGLTFLWVAVLDSRQTTDSSFLSWNTKLTAVLYSVYTVSNTWKIP